MKNMLFAFGALSLMVGCSMVKPTSRSQAIAYLQPDDVQNCRKVGSASVETVSRVLLSRDPKNVQNELITLAKNEAVILKGDAVVAETDIVNGKQEFGVYRCR